MSQLQLFDNAPTSDESGNALVQHQRRITGTATVALVSCVAGKRRVPAAAHELYTSDWFRKARKWAMTHADEWWILSAEHGLLHPSTVIAPYECKLHDFSSEEKYYWADDVRVAVCRRFDRGTTFTVLAGKVYREPLCRRLRAFGYDYDVPMEGLGIGKQKRWLMGRSL